MFAAVVSLTLGREARWAHLWVRGDASGVVPVTAPTTDYFGMGAGAFVVGLGELGPFVDVGGEAGYLFASPAPGSPLARPASLVAVGPVVRLHTRRVARGALLWAQGSVDYVRTGTLDRLGLGVGVGVAWMLSPTIALGPRVDYREIFAMSDAPFPARDAGLVTFGLALEFGLFGSEPADAPPVPEGAPPAIAEPAPDPDPDRDGLSAPADRCPLAAEDPDGFADEDGCPELDNDGDGVSDQNDACPGARGLASARGCPDQDGDDVADRLDSCPSVPGLAAEGGCPRYAQVVVTPNRLELGQKLNFLPATATLLPSSFSVLEQVAQAIRDRAALCLRVEGHAETFDTQRLAQARAEAVRAYLVSKGASPVSLTAVGQRAEPGAPRTGGIRLELVPVACLERRSP
ncbi:MAG: OmpA family protein [Archangium sp.]|nr:OmpA family protein [Archangium sp.]